MMGAVGFTSHIPVFWPEYGVKLWDLLRQKKYVEALELTNQVRVPYYRLITEAWEYSSGDGIVERVACKAMGLNVGPSRKPIQPCRQRLPSKFDNTWYPLAPLIQKEYQQINHSSIY